LPFVLFFLFFYFLSFFLESFFISFLFAFTGETKKKEEHQRDSPEQKKDPPRYSLSSLLHCLTLFCCCRKSNVSFSFLSLSLPILLISFLLFYFNSHHTSSSIPTPKSVTSQIIKGQIERVEWSPDVDFAQLVCLGVVLFVL
jgi:hypothetical protein